MSLWQLIVQCKNENDEENKDKKTKKEQKTKKVKNSNHKDISKQMYL